MRVVVPVSLFFVWWMVLNLILFNFGDLRQSDVAPVAFLGAIPTTIVSIYVFRHFRHKPGEFQ